MQVNQAAKVTAPNRLFARMRRMGSAAVVLATLGCLSPSVWAVSQSVADEISDLMAQNDWRQASSVAERYLRQSPDDVRVRFLSGVIASEQGENDKAIGIFSALTREYPSLPEPYNNLAVLYAAQGDQRKAAETLEMAIRTSPSYATAHENLGDLYAQMASSAYAKALQIDASRQKVEPKLALIHQIVPASDAASMPVAVAVASAPTPPSVPRLVAPSTPAEAPALAPVVMPAPAVSQELPSKVAALAPAPVAAVEKTPTPAPVPAPVRAPEPIPAPAPAPAPTAMPASNVIAIASAQEKSSQKAVVDAVHAWANAWRDQDIDPYLGAYARDFQPADGTNLESWKAQRRSRIVGRAPITLDVSDIQVDIKGEQATANFQQYYASGGFKTTTRKVLTMKQERGHWRIVGERTGR